MAISADTLSQQVIRSKPFRVPSYYGVRLAAQASCLISLPRKPGKSAPRLWVFPFEQVFFTHTSERLKAPRQIKAHL
ncbi:MAG: hypothetical protein ONB47_08480 [candidate division KSB1 bacterium]|nr:hypothetical protein [candidate division KSB1 bacterium]